MDALVQTFDVNTRSLDSHVSIEDESNLLVCLYSHVIVMHVTKELCQHLSSYHSTFLTPVLSSRPHLMMLFTFKQLFSRTV